jgi:hypothetical protein
MKLSFKVSNSWMDAAGPPSSISADWDADELRYRIRARTRSRALTKTRVRMRRARVRISLMYWSARRMRIQSREGRFY